MDQEEYGRFVRAQGLRVVRAAGELWVEKRRFFLESIPPHRRMRLDRWNAAKLFLRGYTVLRFSCDETEGQLSYEYILDDKEYSLEIMGHKVRNHTKKGLKECEVRPVDFDLLAEHGCAINRCVFERQGRVGPVGLTDEKRWRKYMEACKTFPDVEPWGCFFNGQLCAYLLGVFVDDYVYSYHGFCHTDYLKHKPMNALFYAAFHNFLHRPTVNRVSFGLQSFARLESLEHFKEGFGFRKQAIGRQVLVNPLARPFFTAPFEKAARGLTALKLFKRPLDDYVVFSQALREQYSGERRSEE